MHSSAAAIDPGLSKPVFSVAYRRYAMALLLVIYTINFIDRQIVQILAEPIKHEFHLADWQIGLLSGFAFALFYATLGLPIARLAERANRPRIIAVAVAVWSGCTALCGLSSSFGMLLLARIGVGVGEAGCSPPGHSLICDTVPREKRASALAFYQLGVPLGALLGLVIGGVVASAYGWRAAFMLVGAPGLAFALLAALTLREPRLHAAARGTKAPVPSFRQAMAVLRGKKSYWLVCLAAGVKGVIGYGQGIFIASFFLRNHGDSLAEMAARYGLKPLALVGITIGIASGIGGLIGTYGGGVVTDRLVRRSARGYVTFPAIASLIVVPLSAAMVMVGSPLVAMGLYFLQAMFAAVWPGPVYAVCQGVVPANMRATSSAIQLFIGNITGLCMGPLAIGLLSDFFAGPMALGPGEGIRWALFCCSLMGFVAFALFWRARLYIEDELES